MAVEIQLLAAARRSIVSCGGHGLWSANFNVNIPSSEKPGLGSVIYYDEIIQALHRVWVTNVMDFVWHGLRKVLCTAGMHYA